MKIHFVPNTVIFGVKHPNLMAKKFLLRLLFTSLLIWTTVVGLSFLSQWLANGYFIPGTTLQEQLNTFLYGATLLLLITLLQASPKFPKLLETRWLLFQIIISAFSYLIFDSLFVEITADKGSVFVSKSSSMSVSILDKIFGNGFGIYAIVLVIFSSNHRRIIGKGIKVIEDKPSNYVDRFKIKLAQRTYFVNATDILYMKSANNYVEMHTREGKHLIRQPLSQLELNLDPDFFIRIHRSIIIKIDEVAEFQSSKNGDYRIKMKNGQVLSLGSKYKKLILEKFHI